MRSRSHAKFVHDGEGVDEEPLNFKLWSKLQFFRRYLPHTGYSVHPSSLISVSMEVYAMGSQAYANLRVTVDGYGYPACFAVTGDS